MNEAPQGMTVRKAAPGVYAITPPGSPARNNAGGRGRLTIETLEMELMLSGIETRLNVITQEVETYKATPDLHTEGSFRALPDTLKIGGAVAAEDLETDLHSGLADAYKGATFDVIARYLRRIARKHEYNPVIDYLSGLEWDGVSRLPALYKLMGITDSTLSMALVRKWLYQCVAMLYNEKTKPYGAEGLLVLNGAQGCGKTSLFRRLALENDWFREGAIINDRDKDTQRRCLTTWIAELGEVETTLRSDIEALKAFITRDVDPYRLPYARRDVKEPRRASLCATCNSDAYLIDTTGNRRWFTVPISRIMPYEEIQAFEAEQLWAEIFGAVSKMTPQDRGSCFRLSAEERAALDERNGAHVKPIKAETEVRDIIETAKEKDCVFALMTATAWKELYPVLSRYSAEQIGKTLRSIGIARKQKRLNGAKTPSYCYELPLPDRAETPFKQR